MNKLEKLAATIGVTGQGMIIYGAIGGKIDSNEYVTAVGATLVTSLIISGINKLKENYAPKII